MKVKKDVLVIKNISFYLEVECDDKDTNDIIEEKALELAKDPKNYINENIEEDVIICEND